VLVGSTLIGPALFTQKIVAKDCSIPAPDYKIFDITKEDVSIHQNFK